MYIYLDMFSPRCSETNNIRCSCLGPLWGSALGSLTYRCKVCGSLGVGTCVEVSSPVGGEEALTKLEVLREAPCPHYGHLSEVKLLPVA